MAEEIKNEEEIEQVCKYLTEKELDKVTGGGGKVDTPDTLDYTPCE